MRQKSTVRMISCLPAIDIFPPSIDCTQFGLACSVKTQERTTDRILGQTRSHTCQQDKDCNYLVATYYLQVDRFLGGIDYNFPEKFGLDQIGTCQQHKYHTM